MKHIIEIDVVLKRARGAEILRSPIKIQWFLNFWGRFSTRKLIEFDTEKEAEKKQLGNDIFSILKRRLVGSLWHFCGLWNRLRRQPSRPRRPEKASQAVLGGSGKPAEPSGAP